MQILHLDPDPATQINEDPDTEPQPFIFLFLKVLSHEIDFKNVVDNGQILALIRAAAGFWIFRRLLWFLVEIKLQFPGKC